MKVGISDRAWERVARSVHFTERQTGAGGRLPLGLGSGSPVWVRVGVLATPPATDCESCPDGAPETWRATLAGFGVCGGSPDPNGDLTLTYTTGCTWTGTLNGVAWTLAYVAGAWDLTDNTIGARYTLTGSAWSCTGPNEMGRTGVTGCGESPESVTLAAASPATLKAGAYEAVFQLWNNDAAALEDAPEPNACYAVDANSGGLRQGRVYIGAVVWQYAENGMVLVAVMGDAVDESGSGNGGGCDLETVSFDVVTAVTCDPSGGLTVTTRRVSITGCNLSVSQGDPPAAGSGSGGGGTAFATDCQGTGESLEAHPDVSLSITDGPYSGVYALVWASPALSPLSGDAWQADATISGVPHRFSLFSAGPPGDIRWYLWVTNLNTSGTLVVIAASGACDPFSLAFPGADLGSADDVTVVIPP